MKKFAYLFQLGTYKFKHAFDAFEVSMWKLIGYFVFLNLLMFLPVSMNIVTMDHFNYSFWGMDFHEEVPSFIENDLPDNCYIQNNQLQCGTSQVYTFTVNNKDTVWTVYLNERTSTVHDESKSLVFYYDFIKITFDDNTSFLLDYDHFNNTDFSDLNQLEPELRYSTLINNLFLSIKDVFTLPAILMITAALMAMNIILLVTLAAISMLFKFNQSNFPCYKHMLKLFIIASTIPSLINVGLGFRGLNPFTTIVYNIVTPIIAFFMYRASRQHLQIKG